MEMFAKFLKGNTDVRKGILQRFREMRTKFEMSAFFRTHEVGLQLSCVKHKWHKSGGLPQCLLHCFACFLEVNETAVCLPHTQLIGSSLLILYDRDNRVGVWMIDFAKTMQVEDGITLTHTVPSGRLETMKMATWLDWTTWYRSAANKEVLIHYEELPASNCM